MGKRGKRSASRQIRYSNHIVGSKAHKDREKKERTNTLTTGQIYTLVHDKFGYVKTGAIHFIRNTFDQGEVVADSRGEGTLQQVKK